MVSERYKLRERERHVNIQAIVEEHYERYFDQEEELVHERSCKHVQTLIVHFNFITSFKFIAAQFTAV